MTQVTQLIDANHLFIEENNLSLITNPKSNAPELVQFITFNLLIMKAIFYSTKAIEKDLMLHANHNNHDLIFTTRTLNTETTVYAKDTEAVVVFTNDDVTAPVIHKLAALGIKYIATRSVGIDHIDRLTAEKCGIKIANIPAYSPQAIAEHTVAIALALSRHLVQASYQCSHFNFSLNKLTGFNFYGKTVGLIGLGHISKAAIPIFKGLGCKILGYDILPQQSLHDINEVDLDTLYKVSDIISLHIPLNEQTKYIINRASIEKMKRGVMILNTARGGLIKTSDALEALKSGKIGYFGIDVYENEKGLFFEDHETDQVTDPLLSELMKMPNVLVTPHQAFLTNEALEEIAVETIKTLDGWDK